MKVFRCPSSNADPLRRPLLFSFRWYRGSQGSARSFQTLKPKIKSPTPGKARPAVGVQDAQHSFPERERALEKTPPLSSSSALSQALQTGRRPAAGAPSPPIDAYVSTLEKPLIPSHTRSPPSGTPGPHAAAVSEEEELEALTRKDGYDPAKVIRVNKRTQQLHLNSIQKELVWSARRKEYQSMLERFVACMQSHRSPIERCFTLLALHEEVIQRRLRLRADTYEGIFHTFYAVAVQSKGATGHLSSSAQASLTEGHALLEEDLYANPSVSGSVPEELASTVAASQALLTPQFIGNVWQTYRYMVDSGTNPSPLVVQYVMGMLEHAVGQVRSAARGGTTATATTTLLEAKAHSLMMDLDRFKLPPTEYTLNSYIGVCDGCGVMHLAVARVADYQSRHERQGSAGTYAKLITGLVRHGQHREAMSVVSTMQSVPMTTYLLNAVLQAARFSHDPLAAFTFYRAVVRTRGSIRPLPSQVTFSVLLEVICSELALDLARDGSQNARMPKERIRRRRRALEENLGFVLQEMKRHRVKGNGLFLNKLLGLLCRLGREKEAAALRASMEAKGVRVFDELKAG